MSEPDTTRPAGGGTDQLGDNTPPHVEYGPAQRESRKTRLVIPLILMIVVTVVIVATFFDDEFDRIMAMPYPAADKAVADMPASVTRTPHEPVADDHEPPAVVVTDGIMIAEVDETVSANPEETTGVRINVANGISGQDGITASDGAAAATEQMPAVPKSDSATAQAPGVYKPYFHPYYASPDFGTPFQTYGYPDSNTHQQLIEAQHEIWQAIEDRRRRDWEAMIEDHRRARLESENARRERLRKRHESRNARLQRIEQDREAMHRYRRQMRAELQMRRERADREMRDARASHRRP